MLAKEENKPLDDATLLRLVNHKANMVMYPDIHTMQLSEVLGRHGAAIILFEAQPNYGHWTCLFRVKPDMLEFFNPYGGLPDDSLLSISDRYRYRSHQDLPFLSHLLMNSDYRLSYNEHQFQKYARNVKTCGRHVAVRLIFRNLSLKEYTSLINQLCEKLQTDADGVVTILTTF